MKSITTNYLKLAQMPLCYKKVAINDQLSFLSIGTIRQRTALVYLLELIAFQIKEHTKHCFIYNSRMII